MCSMNKILVHSGTGEAAATLKPRLLRNGVEAAEPEASVYSISHHQIKLIFPTEMWRGIINKTDPSKCMVCRNGLINFS